MNTKTVIRQIKKSGYLFDFILHPRLALRLSNHYLFGCLYKNEKFMTVEILKNLDKTPLHFRTLALLMYVKAEIDEGSWYGFKIAKSLSALRKTFTVRKINGKYYKVCPSICKFYHTVNRHENRTQ